MSQSDDPIVAVRRRVLALKDEVMALGPDVASHNSEAARSLVWARAALFEAWTILVGPPEEDEEDH
jgi:hypothetical protein